MWFEVLNRNEVEKEEETVVSKECCLLNLSAVLPVFSYYFLAIIQLGCSYKLCPNKAKRV